MKKKDSIWSKEFEIEPKDSFILHAKSKIIFVCDPHPYLPPMQQVTRIINNTGHRFKVTYEVDGTVILDKGD